MWGNGGREREAEFLREGGEMGARMRAHDWSATPLGRRKLGRKACVLWSASF